MEAQKSYNQKARDECSKITPTYTGPPEFEKIITEKLTNKILFIRQIKTHKCEITGCRKDLFPILFDFPKKNDHVEIAYRDAINHYVKVSMCDIINNVITLPCMKLDEKTTRGIGTHYEEL